MFKVSLKIGALIAQAVPTKVKIIEEYGEKFGLAFQIRDDILDIFGEEQEFGKVIGKDIEGRKLGNIVILYSLEEVDSSHEKGQLSAILRKNNIEQRDIKRALALVEKTKAKERALLLEKEYLDKAGQAKKANCDRIDGILEKLAQKEKKLKKKLEKEKNAAKRKRLKTELKIIAVQRRKGIERREELKGKCNR